MNDAHWSETYDYAVRLFGQAPRPHDEELILQAFARSPAHVKAQIEAIAEAAEIRWKWSALAARLDRARPSRELVVTKAQEREHRIEAAKTWLKNAGLHMTEDEVETELFGGEKMTPDVDWLEQFERDTRNAPGRSLYDPFIRMAIRKTRERGPMAVPNSEGLLAALADDQALRDELMGLWRELRPAGVKAETDALKAADEWKTQRAELAAIRARDRAQRLDGFNEPPQASAAGGSTHEPAGNPQPGPTPAVTGEAAADPHPDEEAVPL